MPHPPSPPPVCPVCGEDVPANALACPECGADHESGWREDAAAGGLDLPEDPGEFDYEDFVAEEFGGGKSRLNPLWIAAALIAAIAFLMLILSR